MTRVAFERRPSTTPSNKMEWSKQPPKRTAASERRASQPTSAPVKVSKPKVNDGFDTGFDGFVEGER